MSAELFRTPVAAEPVYGPWYCVKCGIERPPGPENVCPRPGCGMRAYGSRPPAEPRLPEEPKDPGKTW